MPYTSEHADAARIATVAGQALLELRRQLDVEGVDVTILRAQGDRSSHDLLLRALDEAYPGDPVLSEEGQDNPARLGSRRVWIVDPLDGTREFGEAGRTDWAVHVALVAGGHVQAAAVALPARTMTLSSVPAPTPAP